MKDGAPAAGDRRPDFRRAVRALLARRRARQRGHPGTAVLADYYGRRLPARAAARLREHLAICPACGELVLGLATPSRSPPG